VRKSRQILRRVRRHHPRARLIVSGCLVSLEDQGLATAGLHPDLIVVNRDKDRLVELALIALGYDPDPLSPEASAGSDPAAPLVARGRQRAFVKVQGVPSSNS
jgi:2-methylthioadenine synthetase